MTTKIYFKEIQKFRKWWVMLILFLVLGIWIWGFIQQLIFNIPFGNRPVSDLGLVLIGIIMISPLILIFKIKLITEIREDGLYYKMFPLTSFKKIEVNMIKSWEIKQYKALKKFGGWGIRHTVKNGEAYNIKGKNGLQIELMSGKKLLIGTLKPEKMEKAMKIFSPHNKL